MSYNRILIENKIREFLIEDSNFIDISSKAIPLDSITSAIILTKSNGYISGLEEVQILFNLLKVDIKLKKNDGDQIKKGEILAELEGETRNILLGERVALNLMSHMSAITTTTHRFVDIVDKGGKKTKVACTRKTLPGLRIFEKKAVELGKGDAHRFSLDDMILLKDTHLKYFNGDIKSLILKTKSLSSFTKKIEIEVEKVKDVIIAAESGADIIMLDNMNPELTQEAIATLKANNLRNKVLIEISGNISLQNFKDYLESEPDIISSSALTQKPTDFVDLTLRFD